MMWRQRPYPAWLLGKLTALSRDRRGQAAVETIFALTVLVALILVVAQLFFVSDQTVEAMIGAEAKALKEMHEKDTKNFFQMQITSFSITRPALPGVAAAFKSYSDESKSPGQYSVKRELAWFGGSMMTGMGDNRFVRDGDGQAKGTRSIRTELAGPIVGY